MNSGPDSGPLSRTHHLVLHGWHLYGIEWADYQLRVLVRCPHNQKRFGLLGEW